MKPALTILAITSLFACSNEQIYDAVQHNQQLECSKLPQNQYEECMREADTPYEDYEQQRKEVLKRESR